MPIVTIGLDLAKSVFQQHAIDEQKAVIIMRKRLTRGQVLPTLAKIPHCLIGMEACGSAHHWGREIEALNHEVRLMSGPPHSSSRQASDPSEQTE